MSINIVSDVFQRQPMVLRAFVYMSLVYMIEAFLRICQWLESELRCMGIFKYLDIVLLVVVRDLFGSPSTQGYCHPASGI